MNSVKEIEEKIEKLSRLISCETQGLSEEYKKVILIQLCADFLAELGNVEDANRTNLLVRTLKGELLLKEAENQ